MAYAFTLLAVHPELQDWLAEELDRVIPEPEAEVDYESTFPKLQRCLALMVCYTTSHSYRVELPIAYISTSSRSSASTRPSRTSRAAPAAPNPFLPPPART